MEYNVIKGADKILARSKYVIKNPEKYKNKWHDFFGNKNPIHLELGMGRGDFILEMAKLNPNINFVGIDNNESQMVMAVNNIEKMQFSNVKFINMDALKLDNVFGKEIDLIYLTFCDPWPKRIDERNRFTHPVFLKVYDKIFKKHKHIILKTDNKGFFAYSLESLSNYWYSFNKVSLDLHNDERQIPNVMTNFEKHYKEENRPIYYVEAVFDE